ncbi:DUF4124 domain-containing protein [Pleionea sp. CnH1-48]|uniref:DUF4124 domain-containing protein n=1 Tax=Pleionea sp. CnH1-48 TaxID=2954494 RepID=UPI00209701A8|nr:DUF4124 domain-containing protein [Pleionea sp. CnH1-48]MCO7227075.1 DUF4124 domain-containing protein [Pleionea sp. CnH1-48]
MLRSLINISLVSLLALSLSQEAHAGKIYKWVDENGKVHYSDKPPPKQHKSEEIKVKKSATTKNQVDTRSAQQRVKDAQKWLNSTQEEKKQKRLKQQQQAAEQKQAQEKCAKARRAYQEAIRSNALYDKDKKGNTYVMNEEQRQAAFKVLQQQIKTFCK